MQSRFDPSEAKRFAERHAASFGVDFALRLYTAGLLRAEPSLALHGSGGRSVKLEARDGFGEQREMLFVSLPTTAGADPDAFAGCSLSDLRRLLHVERPSAELLAAEVRRSLRDPAARSPGVEALLHAALPARFVDHTHPDALLAVLHQADSEARVRALYGNDILWVVRGAGDETGFARRLATAWQRFCAEHGREPSLAALDREGLLTWGDTAEEAHARTLAASDTAASYVAERYAAATAVEFSGDPQGQRRTLGLAVRGAVQRASGRHFVARWSTAPSIASFCRRADLREVVAAGARLPGHVEVDQLAPIVVGYEAGEAAEQLAERLDTLLSGLAQSHETETARAWRGQGSTPGAPRVVVVPDLGVLCLGASVTETTRTAEVYQHAFGILEAANAIGHYQPVPPPGDVRPEDVRRSPAQPDASLAGMVALITGAASGIGLATAKAMLAAGAHVLMVDRDERVLDCVVEGPRERHGERVATLCCDVAEQRAGFESVRVACEHFGGVDILVSNAGTAPSGMLHSDSGDEALRRSLDVNLLAHQNFARAVADAMLVQRSGGSLSFNASRSALNQGPAFGPYAIPKAALLALMRQYAIDLGAFGIRSNAVNADRVRTGYFGGGVLETQARARGVSPSEYFRTNLLGRETTAEDVADAFVYLATAAATTGCVLTVDGGNAAAFPR